MADSEYVRKLNEYHCDLADVVEALEHVVFEIPDSEVGVCAMGNVCVKRLQQLVETFPFPPVGKRFDNVLDFEG